MPHEELLSLFAPFGITEDDKQDVAQRAIVKTFAAQTLLNNSEDCLGFVLILQGSIRAYIVGENGKEITLFCLKSGDSCVVCSHCTLQSIEHNILLETNSKSEILIVPAKLFATLKEKYPKLADFTLTLLSKRLSQTITTFEQALFKPLVERIRDFLRKNEHNGEVQMSHESIANHLGSAREVVSRILKEMENRGEIQLGRKRIVLLGI